MIEWHAANLVSAVWQTASLVPRSHIVSMEPFILKLQLSPPERPSFKVRSRRDGQEDGRAVQGVRRQGEREALRRRVVRRLQGVLQEEHQEARRHVSFT